METECVERILKSSCLPAWEMLPDFGLYMDQIIGYVERCFRDEASKPDITPAMINNYVKCGLIDRPTGKKYGRDSLAQLLMISRIKSVASMQTIRQLLHPLSECSTQEIYAGFLQSQDRVIGKYADSASMDPLALALESSVCMLLCNHLIDEQKGHPEEKKG